MQNVYKICPQFENERFLLRLISQDDCNDLLKVYSDKQSVPFFNSDNCNGDDFYYTTMERMKQAIEFWIFSYDNGYFVRWTIVDKKMNEAIGTIELFHRDSEDYFNNCGLLRLDLRSDYETESEIENILSLIIMPTYDLFYCDKIVTKAVPKAEERIASLKKLNFILPNEQMLSADGTVLEDYYVLHKQK